MKKGWCNCHYNKLQCVAARNLDHLSCQHFRLITRQEKNCFGNILGLNQLSHRNYGNYRLFKLCIYPSRLGRPRSNAVNGDSVGRQLNSDAASKSLQGSFACAIGDLTCKNLCCIGGKVDDSAIISSSVNKFAKDILRRIYSLRVKSPQDFDPKEIEYGTF